MVFKSYKDECYIIGISVNDVLSLPNHQVEYFDGYVDISPAEKKKWDKVEAEFWKWQELLGKRYKKA